MLKAGDQLGPYRVAGMLGAGSMGEVYRAEDTRLGRAVALKLLPPGFARDPDRLRRFEQEARTLAGLNHPNLLALYDIGTHEGVPYLVMELLDGETLRARLEGGALPPRKAVEIAHQLADGLGAAHDKGIIHRDLKPENIFLTRDGRSKILDFGLAKLAEPESSGDTATLAGSTPGMAVGTAGYMAPEQVRGLGVDARADLFALGVILYEMLAGRRAFERGSAVETMSAVLNAEPPELSEPLPPYLDRIVRRCLEKEPAQRFQSARDLAFALEPAGGGSSASGIVTGVPPAAPPKPGGGVQRWWPLAAGLLIAAGAVATLLWRPAAPEIANERFTPFSFSPGGSGNAAWSPDGKAVAYSAAERIDDPMQIFVRDPSASAPVQLTHSNNHCLVIGWMGGGRQILFLNQPVNAGPGSAGISLQMISTAGGEAETVPTPINWLRTAGLPVLSPDAKTMLVMGAMSDNKARLWISSPPGSPLRPYQPDPFASDIIINSPRLEFLPSGDRVLLMIDNGQGEATWMLPYPAQTNNPPRKIWTQVPHPGQTLGFSFEPDGRSLVLSHQPSGNSPDQLWLVKLSSGARYPLTMGTTDLQMPKLSPDGRRMIAEEENSHEELESINVETGVVTNLLPPQRSESMPAWAAKAPILTYASTRNGGLEIWVHEGSRPDRPVVTAADFPEPTDAFMGPALSPDGQRIIYTRVRTQRGDGSVKLYISSLAGGAPVPLTGNTTAIEVPGSWSPDGAQYAYVGYHNGAFALMAVPTSGVGTPRVLVDKIEPIIPNWSPTGDWIEYCDLRQKVQLLSPDGSRHRELGKCDSSGFGFSADGSRLYGIRRADGHAWLYAREVSSGAERVIGDAGAGNEPGVSESPSIHLSAAPDGKTLAYSVTRARQSLWLVDGFPTKP